MLNLALRTLSLLITLLSIIACRQEIDLLDSSAQKSNRASIHPDRRPTMLWNGPVEVHQELSSGGWVSDTQSVVLTPTKGRGDHEVVSGMIKPLLMWRLQPNELRSMRIKVPVPG